MMLLKYYKINTVLEVFILTLIYKLLVIYSIEEKLFDIFESFPILY